MDGKEKNQPQHSKQETSDSVENETKSTEDETGEQSEQEIIEQGTCEEEMYEPETAGQETEAPVKIELEGSEVKTDQSNKDGHDSIESNENEHGNNKPETSENYPNEHFKMESDEIESAESNEVKIKPETDEEVASISETTGPKTRRETCQSVKSDEESNISKYRGEATESDTTEKAFAPETTKKAGNTRKIELPEAQEYGREPWREPSEPKTGESERGDLRGKRKHTCESDASDPRTTSREIGPASENRRISESDADEQRSNEEKPIRTQIKYLRDSENEIVEPEQSRKKTNESEIVVCNFIWTVRKSESQIEISEADDSGEGETEPELGEKATIRSEIVVCNLPWKNRESEISCSEKLRQEDGEKESFDSEESEASSSKSDEFGQELNKPEIEDSLLNFSEKYVEKPGQTEDRTVELETNKSQMSDSEENIKPDESEVMNIQQEIVSREGNKLEISGLESNEPMKSEESIRSEKRQQATGKLGQESDRVQVEESQKFEPGEIAVGQGQNEDKCPAMVTEETRKSALIAPDKTETESWKSVKKIEQDSNKKHVDEMASEAINLEAINLERAGTEPSTNTPVPISAEENDQAGNSEMREKSGFEREIYEQDISPLGESEEKSSYSSEWEIVERRTNRRKTKLPTIKLDSLQQLLLLVNAPNRYDLEDSDKANEIRRTMEVQTFEPSTSERRSSDLEEIKPETREEEADEMGASGPRKHRKRKNRKIVKTELSFPGQEIFRNDSGQCMKNQVRNEDNENDLDLIQPQLNESERREEIVMTGSDNGQHDGVGSRDGEEAKIAPELLPNKHAQQTLSEIRTNVVKIDFMYSYHRNIRNLPPLIPDEKNHDQCMQELASALNLASCENNAAALYVYNNAIAMADDPWQIGSCLFGRSRVLYKLGLYKECFEECNKALSLPWLSDGLVGSQLENIRHKASLMIPLAVESRTYHEEVPTILPENQNPNMQSVSDFIQVRNNKQYGRHYIAKKNIDIGQLLMVEDPFISILIPAHRGLHCDHCLELSYAPTPCDSCTSALYCGEACKMEAFESYHKYECRIRKTLEHLRMPNTLIYSVRLIFKARREIFFDEVPHAEDTRYRSDRFKEVYQLQGQSQKEEIHEESLVYSVFSLVFHVVKNYTDFFEEHDEDKFKEVLVNVYSIAMCNTTFVYEVGVQKPSSDYGHNVFAEGVYSAFSLFNHSCAPNTFPVYYGNTAVVYSIQTIKKGQQCFINYGEDFFENTRENRRSELEPFLNFQCNCIACENDWPTMAALREGSGKKTLYQYLDSVTSNLLLQLNVNSARKELGTIIKHLKKAERSMPTQVHVRLMELFIEVHKVLANKNFIMKNAAVELDI